MLGRVKRWVLAMLANAARGSVPPDYIGAFDTPCAWRSSESVGTKGVNLSTRRLRRGSNKGQACKGCVEVGRYQPHRCATGKAGKWQSDLAATVYAAHMLAAHTLHPQLLDENMVLENPVFEHLSVFPNDREAMLAKRDQVRSLAGV